ncbi:MAG: hypothetical protein H6Q72_1899 [Firmicutes bacterium]|nr:hypothetical protein [Bacillota bacterium]
MSEEGVLQSALEDSKRIIDGDQYNELYKWLLENGFSQDAAASFMGANYVMSHDFYPWYDWAQFPEDMKMQQQYDNLVAAEAKITEEEQAVYNAVSARLMSYDSQLEAKNDNIWARYSSLMGNSETDNPAMETLVVPGETAVKNGELIVTLPQNINVRRDFEESGRKFLFQFDIGGYGFRVPDDRADQESLLNNKTSQYGRTMADMLPWVGSGGFRSGLSLREKTVLSTEKLTQGLSKASEKIGTVANDASNDYRITFFTQHPELEGKVVVHHSVEQQVLKRPETLGLFTKEEINAYNNLRGVPKELNSDLHLSIIRKEWNAFYRENPFPSKADLIAKSREIDMKYGNLFNPPIE